MALHPRELKLGEALVRLKVIDELQLASAVASADQWGQRLTEALLRLRLAREISLVEAISALTRTDKIDLGTTVPDAAALALLDAQVCRQRGVFPFALAEHGRVLQLAMVDPSDIALSDSIAARARVRVQRFVAGETTIQKAIQRYYLRMEVTLQPVADEMPISELEELKLVDINGRTLQLNEAVVSLKTHGTAATSGTEAPGAAAIPPSTSCSTPAAGGTAPVQAVGSAERPTISELPALDDILQTGQLEATVDRIEKQLTALRQSQESSDRALRAVIALLLERGHFTADELRARMSRASRGGA